MTRDSVAGRYRDQRFGEMKSSAPLIQTTLTNFGSLDRVVYYILVVSTTPTRLNHFSHHFSHFSRKTIIVSIHGRGDSKNLLFPNWLFRSVSIVQLYPLFHVRWGEGAKGFNLPLATGPQGEKLPWDLLGHDSAPRSLCRSCHKASTTG